MPALDLTAPIEQIEAAIVSALQETGHELVMWLQVYRDLPGSRWSRETAVLRLFERGEVHMVKFQNVPFVALPTDAERAAARRARAEGRVLRAQTVA